MIRRMVFCFLVTSMFFYVDNTDAIKIGDQGVCIYKSSVVKTKLKYISRYCGKKKCYRKVVQSYKQPKESPMCCLGWEYNKDVDSCLPRCKNVCYGGRCIAPDVCSCDSPNLVHPTDRYCIRPCNSSCNISECQSNICQCQSHDYAQKTFQFIQNQCHKCGGGYNITEDFQCTPVCERTCVNSSCVAPNKCSCFKGYVAKDDFTCEPKCECVNSTCVGDKCDCFSGYKKLNETVCIPDCKSCDGDCVGPDICRCRKGYLSVSGKCEPVCENECVNGLCTAPDLCSCNEGFMKNETVPHLCYQDCSRPISMSKPELEAVPKGKPCEQKCSRVQIKSFRFDKRKFDCCVSMRKLKICCSDYKLEKGSCVPVCRPACGHDEYCSEPNKCECKPPLVRLNDTCQNLVCDESHKACVNADCLDNTCHCHVGFRKTNDTHCDAICDDGYEFNATDNTCKAICEPDCINGVCSEPNTCICHPGFEWSGHNFTCKPKCKNCEFGECIAPDVCLCNEGYKKGVNETCKPYCEGGCLNGHCSSPGNCTCDEGYTYGEEGKCEPICEKECKNGYCSEPNTCTCTIGYEFNGSNCEPKCNNCEHGKCVEPEICSCNEGYFNEYENSTCVPYCKESCLNGFCSAPNTCTCKEGYTLDIGNETCKPKCSYDCKHGFCSSPETCSCKEGYIKNSTDPTSCHLPCEEACVHGTCSEYGDCLCGSGFQLINNTCLEMPLVNCSTCVYSCESEKCWCTSDMRTCLLVVQDELGVTTTGMAGFQVTYAVLGAVVLLTVLLVYVMFRIYKKKSQEKKTAWPDHGSVVHTLPGTLLRPNIPEYSQEEELANANPTSEMLLRHSVIEEAL